METDTMKDVDLPDTMRRLPLDPVRQVPVPWFVAWIDGKPDFRIIREGGVQEAVEKDLCWVCGQRRGRFGAFVVGPMCCVNKVSAEPPSHANCAIWSAQHCPFLTDPNRRRRESQMPSDVRNPAGVMIMRNPGVTLVYISKKWEQFDAGNGKLFDMGDPYSVLWFAQGRLATREEVLTAISTGIPTLTEMAEKEGVRAMEQLKRQYEEALRLVPAHV